MAISESIKYIGASTNDLDLFEGQYTVPNGMAYNSYLIDLSLLATYVFNRIDQDIIKIFYWIPCIDFVTLFIDTKFY